MCNQRIKRDKFPLQPQSARVCYEDRHRLAEEQRVLLDPTSDPVEDWISVDWQDVLCRLAPRVTLSPELAARVQSALEFFRINRRVPLIKKRLEIQRRVAEKVTEGKPEEVRHLAIRFQPHSLVAKQFLETHAPEVLPTPEEELEWLLDAFSRELLQKLKILEDAPVDGPDLREAKELFWALAFLWKDPPAGTPELVRAFLDRKGLTDWVQPYFAAL
jgi:hypothetical protein